MASAALTVAARPAAAQNATWLTNPGSNDFDTASNWSPTTVPTGTASFGTSNTTNLTFSAFFTNIGGWTFNAGASNYTLNNSQSLEFNGAGIVVNGGSATITNSGFLLTFSNSSTAGSATITNNSDFVQFQNNSTAGNASITNNSGFLQFENSSTAGSAAITNNSVITYEDSSTAGSAAISNNALIQFAGSSTAGNAAITNASSTGLVNFSGSSGPAGNNRISVGSIAGAGDFYLGANQLTIGANNLSTTVSGIITDCGMGGMFCQNTGATGGSLVKIGSGALTLSGADTYTGATTISAGTLNVTGSIASSSLTTVTSGATLSGTGAVGNLHVNGGGMFAPGGGVPGTGTTVSGNLAFQSGALYLVQVNPATASFTNVSGTASLAGTVNTVFAPGSYLTKQYTILQSVGLNGTVFSGLTTTGLPGGTASLAYNADDVFLDLSVSLPTTGLNGNQQNVANTINNFFNAGGTVSPGFTNLFNLTGSNLANALTQVAGEDSTGAEHGAFELTNEFLGLMLDPFVYGRGGAASGGGPLGFAPDQEASFPPDVALAYAGILKAPPAPASGGGSGWGLDQRWTVWGASFGGSGTANGDPAIGSNNVTTSTYGFAAGADYHLAPDTVLGFALAGSGTNWNLAQALGTGRSDAFQAGIYETKYFGPAYIGGALAFTNNWFATNRTALGDQLTARFDGQSFGARVEGGYRYTVTPAAGVTPYAAIQAQDFHTSSYSETDLTGGGLGLTYNATSATDTQSELGARFDALTAWGAMPVQLRARLAWAHDWVSNPALDASFQALPGTSFVVNGAAVPANSALTSVGAELHLTPRWTLLGKFDGEFASSAQIYAGSGTLRYVW